MIFGLLFAATSTPSPTPTGGTAGEAAGGSSSWLIGLVGFGFLGLLVIVLLYYFLGVAKQPRPLAFTRFYSLMFVAVIAVLLAFGDVASDAKTAAFTLLGTIAGYLAGAKQISETTETTEPGVGDGGGELDDDEAGEGAPDGPDEEGGTGPGGGAAAARARRAAAAPVEPNPARARAANRVIREEHVL